MKKKLLVSLLVATSLFASSKNGFFKEGVNLFDSKDYKGAYEKFEKAFKADMSNPQISFYLGRSAYELGLYDKALIAYERVLIYDENHIRTKLEVGRVYMMLKMFDEAKTEFYEVLDSNPPENVKENVKKILASLEKLEKKSFLNYYATIGMGYDTNINMNPGTEALLNYLENVLGVPRDGATVDKKIGASFLQEVFTINHIYDIGEKGGLYLDSSLNMFNQNFKSNKDYDVLYTSVSSGLGYLKNDYKLSLPITYDKVIYGRSSLLDSIAITPKISKRISKTLSFNTFFKLQRKFYKKDADKGRESDVKEIGLGFSKSIGTHYFDITYSLLNEGKIRNSEDTYIDKDLYNLKLSYFKKIDDLFNLNLQYNFRQSKYDDIVKEKSAKRDDNYKSYLIGASKELSKNTSLLLSYNYIDNNSNYDPIVYGKSIYSFNLNINF